jgi:hypothetical protein
MRRVRAPQLTKQEQQLHPPAEATLSCSPACSSLLINDRITLRSPVSRRHHELLAQHVRQQLRLGHVAPLARHVALDGAALAALAAALEARQVGVVRIEGAEQRLGALGIWLCTAEVISGDDAAVVSARLTFTATPK